MRVLGIDLGAKTIGVAISDALGVTAQSLCTVYRKNLKDDLDALRLLVEEYQVEEVVVGLPRHMNGRLGKEGEETIAFGREIERSMGLPVVFWDERLSTVAAEKTLLAGDVTRGKRRRVVDKIAASWILGGYLVWRRKKIKE